MFGKIREGLKKTREFFQKKVVEILRVNTIDDSFFKKMEEVLLSSDFGPKMTEKILNDFRSKTKGKIFQGEDAVQNIFRENLISNLKEGKIEPKSGSNAVYLFIGVNGVGKTTTIAKLAMKWSAQKRKIQLVAGDTFRAAASDQLEVWAGRLHLPLFKGPEGSDPGSVIFDGLKSGFAKGFDTILVDTAGRFNNKVNLMNELKKVKKVIGKVQAETPFDLQTILVLDATTGGNSVDQAKDFHEGLAIDGIILTKLDSSSKGGSVFAISSLGIPIMMCGVGEKTEDLIDFDAKEFAAGLFEN